MSSKAFRFVCNAFEFQWRAPSVVLTFQTGQSSVPSVKHSEAEHVDEYELAFMLELQCEFPLKLHL